MSYKPRLDQIDWKSLSDVIEGDPQEDSMQYMLDLAKFTLRGCDPILLPPESATAIAAHIEAGDIPDYLARYGTEELHGQVFQIEAMEEGPNTGLIVIALSDNLLAFLPLDTGGVIFYHPNEKTVTMPVGMRNSGKESVQSFAYMGYLVVEACLILMKVPGEIRLVQKEARKTLSRKSKTGRIPAYRVVHLFPNQVRETGSYAVSEGNEEVPHDPESHKGWKMPFNEVRGHWVRRGLDPVCEHEWEDTTTAEVAQREKCLKCGGQRTWRKPFHRGDPDVPRKTKVQVLHIT